MVLKLDFVDGPGERATRGNAASLTRERVYLTRFRFTNGSVADILRRTLLWITGAEFLFVESYPPRRAIAGPLVRVEAHEFENRGVDVLDVEFIFGRAHPSPRGRKAHCYWANTTNCLPEQSENR